MCGVAHNEDMTCDVRYSAHYAKKCTNPYLLDTILRGVAELKHSNGSVESVLKPTFKVISSTLFNIY